jgi:hypothetical protein
VTEVVQDHLVCRSPTSHNLSLTIRLGDPCSNCLSSQFPSANLDYWISSEDCESRKCLMECSASACRFAGPSLLLQTYRVPPKARIFSSYNDPGNKPITPRSCNLKPTPLWYRVTGGTFGMKSSSCRCTRPPLPHI